MTKPSNSSLIEANTLCGEDFENGMRRREEGLRQHAQLGGRLNEPRGGQALSPSSVRGLRPPLRISRLRFPFRPVVVFEA
jgi:hypothetical protein